MHPPPEINEGNIMTTPSNTTEGLWLPAERARRGGFYLGSTLAAMLCLVLFEGLILFVVGVLIMGEGMGFMGEAGVAGYAGLPVLGGAVTLLPLIALASRYPALRIDPAGISKVQRGGTETVRWADIDQVRFNSRQSLLLLVLKEGALPEKPIAVGGPRMVVHYSLGNSLWRRRRPNHPALIVDAVGRFAAARTSNWSPSPLTSVRSRRSAHRQPSWGRRMSCPAPSGPNGVDPLCGDRARWAVPLSKDAPLQSEFERGALRPHLIGAPRWPLVWSDPKV
ncbi:PH domain-containing protein [Streptomyces sp. NPDC088394]|uniref:PH domain-containing protein n=1 Tax=Streptomyces sp. NPDC088394 TaxID=3365860 RepID=UPI00380A4E05